MPIRQELQPPCIPDAMEAPDIVGDKLALVDQFCASAKSVAIGDVDFCTSCDAYATALKAKILVGETVVLYSGWPECSLSSPSS